MRGAALLAVALAALGGCSRPRATQVVLGIVTDLSAPGEIDRASLLALNGGAQVAKFDWDFLGIPSDTYELPGSFSLYSDDGSEPRLEVQVRALRGDKPQVTRTAVFGLVKDQTLFLRLGLSRRCLGVTCAVGSTCVEGGCQSALVEAATLPAFATGMEKSLECDSGSRFARTSNKQEMPITGACAGNEVCLEGSCRMMDPSRIIPDLGISSGDGL